MNASRPDDAPTYRAGGCNIGPAEIARRRRGAWLASAATVAFYVALVALGPPPAARLLVALPAASAAVSWLQVRERFCVAFGGAGVFNFGPLGRPLRVTDAAARRADRRKAASMVLRGGLLGLGLGVLAALIPVP